MKITVIGANSFVARSIKPLLDESYLDVKYYTREELDATDMQSLYSRLFQSKPDFLINCAMSGGGRLTKRDYVQNFYNNILMHENILACDDLYGHLIDFTSGAQYDRSVNIINRPEGAKTEPCSDFYALAKRVNSERSNQEGHFNLRIFNVFGPLELENRFIKTAIRNCMAGRPIEIWGEARFDFFYVEDLFLAINSIIKKPYLHGNQKEMNCVYEEKYTFSEVANIIKGVTESKSEIIVRGGINRHYTGCGRLLSGTVPNLLGLKEGIRRTYLCLKQEKTSKNL